MHNIKIRDLFTDERCSQAIQDFFFTTDVGRLVPCLDEEAAHSRARRRSGNIGSATKGKRSGNRRPRGWALRVRNDHCSSPCPLS